MWRCAAVGLGKAQFVFETAMISLGRNNLACFPAFVSGDCVGSMGLAALACEHMSLLTSLCGCSIVMRNIGQSAPRYCPLMQQLHAIATTRVYSIRSTSETWFGDASLVLAIAHIVIFCFTKESKIPSPNNDRMVCTSYFTWIPGAEAMGNRHPPTATTGSSCQVSYNLQYMVFLTPHRI